MTRRVQRRKKVTIHLFLDNFGGIHASFIPSFYCE